MERKRGIFRKLLLVLLAGVCAFAGLAFSSSGLAFAKTAEGIYGVKLTYDSSIYEISYLKYSVDGIIVEYSSAGFSETVGTKEEGCFYKITFSGESGSLNLMKGDARVEYSVTEPFADVLSDYNLSFLNLPRSGQNYTEEQLDKARIPVDKNTDLEVKFAYRTKTVFDIYYLTNFTYKQGTYGTSFEIDRTSLNRLGEVDFVNGVFDEETKTYSRTINLNFAFVYANTYENGLYFKAKNIISDMGYTFNTSQKVHSIEFVGSGAGIGSSNQYFSYTSVADIKLSPTSGTIVSKADMYIGEDLQFSVYGGMYTSGDYSFLTDTTDMVVASYGNFAVAISSEYSFEVSSSAGGNYAKIVCYNAQSGGQELYSVTIDDSGEIHIYVTNIYAWLKVDITNAKYAQLDLKLIDGNSGTFSGDPFKTVIFEYDGKTIRYDYVDDDNKLNSRYFVLGFSDKLKITVVTRRGYNYDSTVNPLLITGDTYYNPEFSGGLISISATNNELYSVTVALYLNGDLFKDVNTKIYFSIDDITDPSGFLVSDGGAEGMATKTKLPAGTILKVRVDISKYYMLEINGDTYTKMYYDLNYAVSGNSNIILVVKPISFERPVYESSSSEDKIGDLKISLNRLNSTSSNGQIKYRAVYDIAFKPIFGSEYLPVEQTNPSVFGMLLNYISVVSEDGLSVVIIKQINNTFVIDSEDSSVHEAIATMCFNQMDSSGHICKIVANFTPKLSNFIFTLNDVIYKGSAYYGAKKMYLDKEVLVSDWYKYFAGVKYAGAGVERIFYTEERVKPVLVDSGEFAGLYEYTLTNEWVLDGENISVEAVLDNRSFLVSYVFTYLENGVIKTEIISKYIKYGADFSVDTVNENNRSMPIIDSNASGSKFIGWNIEYDESINYIDDADGCNYTAHEVLTFTWDTDIRFIPVFSKSVSLIEIKDAEGNLVHSVHVKYDTDVDEEGLLKKDGEYIILSRFGYYFLGYFTEGVDSVKFISVGDNSLFINYADLDKFFKDENGTKKWILTENITLIAKFDAIEYTASVTVSGEKYRDGDVSINVGQINSLGNSKYFASGFTISDFVIIGGFRAKSNGFVAKVRIINRNSASLIIEDIISFSAVCNRNGITVASDEDGRFNPETGEFSFLVTDFVSEDSDWASLTIEIEYLPISYVISFETKPIDINGKVINNLVGEKVYYYMTKDDASFDKMSSWVVCDEKGEPLSPTTYAWKNIMLGSLTFKEFSLYGIAGIKIEDSNGKSYSFKKWADRSRNVDVKNGLVVDYGYDFVSIFSDVSDITINYYSYLDVTREYTKISTSGYFWNYDEENNKFYVDTIKLANMYEIYLIAGKLYYISGWSSMPMESFNSVVSEENYYKLMQNYSVDYSSGNIEKNFYAVYSLFSFEKTEDADNIVINVGLPNDVNGNGYSSADVLFVAINETDYSSYDGSGLSDADILAKILSTSDLLNSATVARGNTYNKSLSVPSGKKLFAVVQRKVDGLTIDAFYVAIAV